MAFGSAPEPFATVVPLYSGVVVVRIGDRSLRIVVPRLEGTRAPAQAPPRPTVAPPQGDPPPLPPDWWKTLPPIAPAASILLAGGSLASPLLAGYLQLRPDYQQFGRGFLADDPYDPDLFALPEAQRQHIVQAVSLDRLPILVERGLFDRTSAESIVLHARGPDVDLTSYAESLSAVWTAGAGVVVMVHPPHERGVVAWRPVR